MIITLPEIKKYLRLDEEDTTEDDQLTSFLLAAEEYIKNATGFKFEIAPVPETAKLIVKMLVSHWYDNRAVETTNSVNKIAFSVNVLLTQLSYSYTEDVVLP